MEGSVFKMVLSEPVSLWTGLRSGGLSCVVSRPCLQHDPMLQGDSFMNAIMGGTDYFPILTA